MQKLKRKIEGDLKLTQEAVGDLERIKADLNAALQRKEKEAQSMGAKIEDESTLGGKYGKQVKELHTRVEELDEELFLERQNRAKAEKNRSVLSRDIQDLGSRLEEAGSNTSTQIELNKKREAELMKLKGELEEVMRVLQWIGFHLPRRTLRMRAPLQLFVRSTTTQCLTWESRFTTKVL